MSVEKLETLLFPGRLFISVIPDAIVFLFVFVFDLVLVFSFVFLFA